MRRVVTWFVVLSLSLAASTAAQTQMPKPTPAPAASENARKVDAKPTAKPDASKENKANKPAPKESSEVRLELQHLRAMLAEQSRELEAQRAMLREQQQKMKALEGQIEEQAQNESRRGTEAEVVRPSDVRVLEGQIEAVAESTKEIGERVAKVQTDLAGTQKSTESRLKGLGRFAFSGDFRGRFESFNGGALSNPRYRERFRLRFNVKARLSDEIDGGFTLASGDLFDPISTNQTLTDFYVRKPIAIDKAYLTYTPKWFQPLGNFSITGGKFGYTWYRTEMTLDNDLNVEGISPSISWDLKSPGLKRIAIVGFALPFSESSSGLDSFLSGGQVQTQWQLGDRLRLSTFIGFMDFNSADRIRAAQTADSLNGSSNSNAATSTQFASKFGLLDTTLRADVKTPWSRWPLMTQFNYVNNTRACTNLKNISDPNPPACNPRDRDGYWAEWQFGRTKERGDINFGYTFIRIEQEAVLAAFNFSDLRAPSNLLTHRLNFAYQAYNNITIGWTGLFGRQLVTTTSPTKEDILRRMQLDFIYKF